MHGGGSPKRERAGKRKPPGRPVLHGRRSDPDRTRYDSLGRRFEEWLKDHQLRIPDRALAMQRAALDDKFDAILRGEFDVMRTAELPEDPHTWLIDAAGAVVEKVMRVQTFTYKEPMRAAMAIFEPALRVVQDAIERFVPVDQREACSKFIGEGLAKVVVPNC